MFNIRSTSPDRREPDPFFRVQMLRKSLSASGPRININPTFVSVLSHFGRMEQELGSSQSIEDAKSSAERPSTFAKLKKHVTGLFSSNVK
jgi:hypothetical protein